MTKRNTKAGGDQGPARNTKSRRSKGKAVNVVPENSVQMKTKKTSVKVARKYNHQDVKLAKVIVAAIAEVLPPIVVSLMKAMESEKKKIGCTYPTFLAYKPKTFNGENGPCEAVKWVEEMEAILNSSGCAEEKKVMFAASSLESYAWAWWGMTRQSLGIDVRKMTWEEFKKKFMKYFCSSYHIMSIEGEFRKLEMMGLEHSEYTAKFNEMARVVPHLVTPESNRIERYVSGLAPKIRRHMIVANPSTFQSAVDLAGRLTDDMIREAKEVFGSKRKWDRKCNKYHFGECNQKTCYNCMEVRTCYECGETGHVRFNCPNKEEKQVRGNTWASLM